MDREQLLGVIRASLWEAPAPVCVDDEIFREMKAHGIAALAAPALTRLHLTPALRREWELAAAKQAGLYIRYMHAQQTLPVAVPYVILKGSAAARYYPFPEYRAMGDIDIFPCRQDFSAACEQLLQAGFQEEMSERCPRHRAFRRNWTMVEVHQYFASMHDPACAQYLDDLILTNINPEKTLPDPVNGLVLLEHINHHLEDGLGLRQIIDWMMFVHRCLPDGAWPDFCGMARKIGLETLAVAVTHMCEMYLGLPARAWSAAADEAICARLMDYVLLAGNFGHRLQEREETVSREVLFNLRYPARTLASLQRRGQLNWPAAQRCALLRPFAWLYQLGRYVRKGLTRKHRLSSLRADVRAAREKDAMFEALGIRRKAKGVAVYRDGEYRVE